MTDPTLTPEKITVADNAIRDCADAGMSAAEAADAAWAAERAERAAASADIDLIALAKEAVGADQ